MVAVYRQGSCRCVELAKRTDEQVNPLQWLDLAEIPNAEPRSRLFLFVGRRFLDIFPLLIYLSRTQYQPATTANWWRARRHRR